MIRIHPALAAVTLVLVCAATALVWAGGQCFPRMALSLMHATPQDSVGAV